MITVKSVLKKCKDINESKSSDIAELHSILSPYMIDSGISDYGYATVTVDQEDEENVLRQIRKHDLLYDTYNGHSYKRNVGTTFDFGIV